MEKIGIFPLKNVLFPESAFPLHIFEKRYKELIADCLLDNKPFGYILKMPAHDYNVGCLANISDILAHYDDGKMDILVIGTKRFNILKVIESVNSYNVAEIEYFEDLNETNDGMLLRHCIDVFNTLAQSIKSVQITNIELDSLTTKYPSYLIAQKAGMTLIQKQNFLEIRSENNRLRVLLDHLEHILPMVREAEFITQLIKNDGYYTPKFL